MKQDSEAVNFKRHAHFGWVGTLLISFVGWARLPDKFATPAYLYLSFIVWRLRT